MEGIKGLVVGLLMAWMVFGSFQAEAQESDFKICETDAECTVSKGFVCQQLTPPPTPKGCWNKETSKAERVSS
jgi:hypothetical protein